MFEIGLVYKKDGRYFLAVDKDLLITGQEGTFFELRPAAKFDVARKVAVSKLCHTWGCTPSAMDATVRRYLCPNRTPIRMHDLDLALRMAS